MSRYTSSQRQELLETAIGLFAEHGLKGMTIRDLAGKAKVNSALLYYYFENKESLFRECLRAVLDGFLDRLHANLRPFTSARDRLSFLVDGIMEYYIAHPKRMRLMGAGLPLHAALFAQVLNGLPARRPLLPLVILQEGMERKELRRLNPLQAWWSMLGMCMFSLYVEDVLPHIRKTGLPFELPDLRARREQILDMLVAGMQTASGAASPSRKRSQKK